MKRFLFILSASALLFSACKNGGEQTTSTENDTYQKLYTKSMKLKDLNTAIFAIQMILVSDSTNGLRDSLPELYGAVNNVEACMQTNEDALKRHPKLEKYLNIKVLCLQQIGDMDGQFILLDQLYKETHKPQYVAQMASLQLAGGQTAEAIKTIDFIISEYKNK